ncbi:MAG: hypothetical protein WCG04_05105 [Alphaproteobacteria bacterium]
MSVVRAALTLSLAIVISVGMVVLFLYNKERFNIVAQNNGIFVFDSKNATLSFCTNKKCTLISINSDHYPARDMSLIPQGFIDSTPPYPQGFISPNAVTHQNPVIYPQYQQPAAPVVQPVKAPPPPPPPPPVVVAVAPEKPTPPPPPPVEKVKPKEEKEKNVKEEEAASEEDKATEEDTTTEEETKAEEN